MKFLIRLIKQTYHMAGPDEGKEVMKNVLSLSWLQAITYVLPVIIFPYLFRILGPDKFGLIIFAQAFVQYFMILTDYGFGQARANVRFDLYVLGSRCALGRERLGFRLCTNARQHEHQQQNDS